MLVEGSSNDASAQIQQQPSSNKLAQQLRILNFYSPIRVLYHVQRLYNSLKSNSNNSSGNTQAELQTQHQLNIPNLWDILHVKYAFSYSRVLAIYALHYLTTIKSFSTHNIATPSSTASSSSTIGTQGGLNVPSITYSRAVTLL